MKTCNDCGRTKLEEDFYERRLICKACYNALKPYRRRQNTKVVQNNKLLRSWGVVPKV